MAMFQAGSTLPSGTVELVILVPDDVWFKRALLQALFYLSSPQNWDNIQGTLSVDECASLASKMIESMEWTP